MKSKLPDPKVFMLAASLVDIGEIHVGCCKALDRAGYWMRRETNTEYEFLRKMFRPSYAAPYWWPYYESVLTRRFNLATEITPRIIALVLCAEIAKDMRKVARLRSNGGWRYNRTTRCWIFHELTKAERQLLSQYPAIK
jgi:hypothetical protein